MKFFLPLVLISILGASICYSDENKGSISALGGVSSRSDVRFAVGAKAHYKVLPDFGLGVVFNQVPQAGSTSYSISHLDVDVDYQFKGFWIGARLGYAERNFYGVWNIASVPVTTVSNDAGFEIGPAIGYDFMITNAVSIGVDLSDLILYTDKIYTQFQGFVAVGYHF